MAYVFNTRGKEDADKKAYDKSLVADPTSGAASELDDLRAMMTGG